MEVEDFQEQPNIWTETITICNERCTRQRGSFVRILAGGSHLKIRSRQSHGKDSVVVISVLVLFSLQSAIWCANNEHARSWYDSGPRQGLLKAESSAKSSANRSASAILSLVDRRVVGYAGICCVKPFTGDHVRRCSSGKVHISHRLVVCVIGQCGARWTSQNVTNVCLLLPSACHSSSISTWVTRMCGCAVICVHKQGKHYTHAHVTY